MHILLAHCAAIPVFAYGGTERVVWDLGRLLVALGHRVSYLVPAHSTCDFARVLPLRADVPLQAQIPHDVDVAHFQFDPGEALETPWLVTEHGNAAPGKKLPINSVFVSRDHARRHGAEAFVLNGLDWRSYGLVNMQSSRSHFHFLGKAAWRVKNVRGAIDVARLAGVPLSVLGGHRFNFKRGLRFTFSPSVRFHGMVGGAEKAGLLAASRGLIFPVIWHEPFGLAVIESLYFGCPVFATPYGALPELVPPECGALSASRRELTELLLSSSFDRRTCHEHALHHFNAARMAAAYVKLYERVLDGESLNTRVPVGPADNRLSWTA
ncbi:glycosyltransferase [Variovorax sp. VNK109]|uniref:glycosyltransferase n=1 Tax=Variovorax sp. VNK109 TaxID=3400919 RepID=UPI003BFB9D9D